jgi:two-component system, sensor histidine kinase PdtaS
MFNYLKDIYDESGESYLEKNITVEKLDIDTVIPLGLLINEIFSNAFKYALKESETKCLIVSLAQIKANAFELKIKDSGKGFNYNQKRNAKSSFGLELIDLLVSQLNGNVIVNTNINTEYIVTFESIGKTQ